MKLKKALVILPLIALVAASCNKSSQTSSSDTSGTSSQTSQSDQSTSGATTGTSVKPTSLTVDLAQLGNSKQTGTASLNEDATGKVTVTINVTGEAAGSSEPAHIHSGSCPTPGAIAYNLNNVTNGTSTTTINASLADLLAAPMAINVHKSSAALNTYMACGDIVMASSSTTGASDTPDTTK